MEVQITIVKKGQKTNISKHDISSYSHISMKSIKMFEYHTYELMGFFLSELINQIYSHWLHAALMNRLGVRILLIGGREMI